MSYLKINMYLSVLAVVIGLGNVLVKHVGLDLAAYYPYLAVALYCGGFFFYTCRVFNYRPVPIYLFEKMKSGKKLHFFRYFSVFLSVKKHETETFLKRKICTEKIISTNIAFHEKPFFDSDSAQFFKVDCLFQKILAKS
jgi:hypothetical protein